MLFKYLPRERIDVLENLSIRFSPLLSLNDPFEQSPLIDMKVERKELQLDVESEMKELINTATEEEKTDEFYKLLQTTKDELLRNIENKTNPSYVGKELISLLGDNFGVLSLSRTEKSLLMWSHYAGEGKGLVLGLDDSHPFFKQRDLEGNITRPLPITYSSNRRKVIPNEKQYYQKLLCEKPLEWAYEEEERLFYSFGPDVKVVGKDDYDQKIILSALPKEAIKAVYIGYQTSKSDKERILSAITKNNIICSQYFSSICNEEYKIVFKGVK